MKSCIFRSPAKLNLYLKVHNKRPDGYHNITTLFERIDLCDVIHVRRAAKGKVRIFCEHPDVPTGPQNLVYKVAQILRERYKVTYGVDIVIEKKIPVAAGLAGGSSNAACVLKGLNKIWGLALPFSKKIEIAQMVGADVPFFLYNTSWALGTHRGDQIQKLSIKTRIWQILIVPRFRLLTRKVFGGLNLQLTKPDVDVNMLAHYLRNNDITLLSSNLINDLESSILKQKPVLKKIKEKIMSLNPLGACFSGSGPAIFGLTRSFNEAEAIRQILQKRFSQVYVVRTI